MLLLSCAVNVNIEDIPQEMVKILAAGKEFQMGSIDSNPNEKPVHSVKFIKDFLISKTEAIQVDYEVLMGVNPSKSKGDSLPVERVSWFDAVLYCNARSKEDGFDTVYEYTEVIGNPGDSCELKDIKVNLDKNGYRLPTEAEWEYAYRGSTTTEYYWGNSSDFTTVSKYAWYSKNSDNKTHTVGKKIPNAYGLYDMSGNVIEWCNDWYSKYSSDTAIDPTGPDTGSGRVIRGGCKFNPANFCKASYRGYNRPTFRCSVVGFRIARSL